MVPEGQTVKNAVCGWNDTLMLCDKSDKRCGKSCSGFPVVPNTRWSSGGVVASIALAVLKRRAEPSDAQLSTFVTLRRKPATGGCRSIKGSSDT
jgi:hypothetical protein